MIDLRGSAVHEFMTTGSAQKKNQFSTGSIYQAKQNNFRLKFADTLEHVKNRLLPFTLNNGTFLAVGADIIVEQFQSTPKPSNILALQGKSNLCIPFLGIARPQY
jgi:hypothetical protein